MTDHHRVVKRSLNDPMMTSVIVAGTGVEGLASNELKFPLGIFIDETFDLYVANCGSNRVQLFQSGQLNGIIVAGEESPYPTIKLYCPSGISFDASKYLFIADMFHDRIVGSGPNGFRCLVGCYGQGSESNQLFEPVSFSFDRSGNMFVIDQSNNRTQQFLLMENSSGKAMKNRMR